MSATLKNSDEFVSSLLAEYAKLNELNEPQMDTVKEAVKKAVESGITIGHATGTTEGIEITANAYNIVTQKLLLARTFMASLSAIIILYAVIQHTSNVPLSFFMTALLNVLGFFGLDLIAKGIRWINLRIRKYIIDRQAR